MSPDFRAKAIPLGLALVSLAFYAHTTLDAVWFTTFDDAYMFARYARHFLAGAGFSWNAVDGPSYGITSPAYLFLVTAVLGLTGGSDAALLTGLSFTAGMLAVAALVWLVYLCQKSPGSRTSWTPLLVVPFLLYLTPLRYHSMTGMETTLALLANTLFACALVVASRRRSASALGLCVLAGYFAFAVRPDHGLYALFLPPLFFIATDRTLWRYSLRYAIFFAVVLAADALLKTFLFGGFLPLSFFAKKSGFYQGYTGAFRWNAMEWMLQFWTMAGLCFALVIGKAPKRRIPLVAAVALPLAATLAYYATVVQIMGFEARYYFPSLAFVILMAAVAVKPHDGEAPAPASPAENRARILIGLLVLLPAASGTLKEWAAARWQDLAIGKPPAIVSGVSYRTAAGIDLPPLDWFQGIRKMADLLRRLPPGVVFAASEQGFIGARLPDRTIIDLVGLNDRTIASKGFSAEYVLSRKPDLLWFPHWDYTGVIAQLVDHPGFFRDYDYYPGAFSYGIALRKSSEDFAAIRGEVEKDFAETYLGSPRLEDYRAEPVAAAGSQAP